MRGGADRQNERETDTGFQTREKRASDTREERDRHGRGARKRARWGREKERKLLNELDESTREQEN